MQRAQADCEAAEVEAKQAAGERRRAAEAEARDLEADAAMAAVTQAALAADQMPIALYLLGRRCFATEWLRAAVFLPRPMPGELLDLASRWSAPSTGTQRGPVGTALPPASAQQSQQHHTVTPTRVQL